MKSHWLQSITLVIIPLPLSSLQCIKKHSLENKYFYCYRKHVLQLEFFYFLLFHGTANINGPLINFSGHRFSDLHSSVDDLTKEYNEMCLGTREW